MSTVTKSNDMDVYRIRAGHGDYEWATICIIGWQATGVDERPRECGEILIHSSYGSWANSWGDLGEPFKQFLIQAERGYVASKFMGSKAHVFDGEKTVRGLRRSLIESRRYSDLDKEVARAIWEWIEESESDLESSADIFCERMFSGLRELSIENSRAATYFFGEPWDRIRTSLDNQFAGFWREIWLEFAAALRAEIASKVSA